MTFAFVDVVGSTQALSTHGEAFIAALADLHVLVERTVSSYDGVVVSTEGDGAFLAFADAVAAVDALRELQASIELASLPEGRPRLRVRVGAHAGDAVPICGDYIALPVHVAARVSAAANAGQVLVTQDVADDLGGAAGECLGEFALRDIAHPVVVWRLVGDATPPRVQPWRRTNVASPRTSFVGRAAEIAALADLLGHPGFVTVAGPGGLGKTRLVSELALQTRDLLAGGAWLVELAPLTEPEQVLGAVAAVLDIDGATAVAQIAAEIERRGEMLLVLDNCEHLVDAAANVAAELVASCPGLRLVCTSREPLAVDGETVVRLAPLGTAQDALTAGPAEELFLSRAKAAGARLDVSSLSDVTRICQRLDGLPLALELAAARAGSTPIAALADALAAGRVELRRRGSADRQRSLDELVSWSLRLLDDEHRTALLILSVLPGRFSNAMATELLARAGMSGSAASELSRRSLLDVDGVSYRMLNTVRNVVRADLAAVPDVESTANEALLSWASAVSASWFARDISAVDVDRDTALALEQALRWGLSHDRRGLGELADMVRAWSYGHALFSDLRSLGLAILAGPPPSSSDEVTLHTTALQFCSGLAFGPTPISLDVVEPFVVAAREVAEGRVLVRALGVAGSTLDRLGLHERAQSLHREAIELISGSVAYPRMGSQHGDFGVSFHLSGQLAAAEAQYRLAVAACRDQGDEVNLGVFSTNLGEVLLDLGRVDEAAEQLRASARLSRGRQLVSAVSLALLAEAELSRGSDQAWQVVVEAERELAIGVTMDVSLQGYVDRFRAAVRAAQLALPAASVAD